MANVARLDRSPLSGEESDGSLEFETLRSELSLRLVDLPPDEVDEAIEGALSRVSEVLEIDSSALWKRQECPRRPSASPTSTTRADVRSVPS